MQVGAATLTTVLADPSFAPGPGRRTTIVSYAAAPGPGTPIKAVPSVTRAESNIGSCVHLSDCRK